MQISFDDQFALMTGAAAAMGQLVAAEPSGRLGRPEAIDNAVLCRFSPPPSYVVGHALTVDVGYTAQ